MIIYFQKILTFLLSPLGIILFLNFLLIFRCNKKIILLNIFILFFLSSPQIANYLFSKLENYTEITKIDANSAVHSVVILGGGETNLLKSNNNKEMTLIDKSGRYLNGINLFKKINATNIVISDLKIPWNSKFDNQIKDLIEFFMFNGINSSDIIILNKPLNTHDESEQLLSKIGKKKIALVTSAYHSKRAEIIFKKKGFDVNLLKVDNISRKIDYFNLLNYLPSPDAIQLNSLLFKEIIGIIYYSLI